MRFIKLLCEKCRKQFDVVDTLRGHRIECPYCAAEMVLPPKNEMLPESGGSIESHPAPAEADFTLHDQEKQIFTMRPALRAFWGEMLIGALLLPLYLIGLLFFAYVFYRINSLKYVFTSERMLVQHGLIAKHLEEVELFRMKDLVVRQDVVQRILGVGTITLVSTDQTTPRLDMIGIISPEQVKDKIRRTFRQSRVREGVRPVEFIP